MLETHIALSRLAFGLSIDNSTSKQACHMTLKTTVKALMPNGIDGFKDTTTDWAVAKDCALGWHIGPVAGVLPSILRTSKIATGHQQASTRSLRRQCIGGTSLVAV